MSLRSACITKLAENMATVLGVTTVVVTNGDVDAQQYSSAQMPLLAIRVDSETPNYETSRWAEWVVNASMTLFFLARTEETSAKETLITAIKNKIGSDPTLNSLCEMCEYMSSSSSGEYPLFKEIFSLKILFERSISDV